MKKVIFISAIALAAAVSCTKSEVVDTKFNEQIGFETYLGRDAMTKAPVATSVADLGLFGFYTGNDVWKAESSANLWNNEKLVSPDFAPSTAKYWTNDSDKYTFLAYAPYENETKGIVAVEGANPKVTFTVNRTISQQVDLLYANTPADVNGANGHVNMVKPSNNQVALKFNHALSRITVKASENVTEFDYTIKGLSLSGTFNTKGTLKLSDNSWTVEAADKKDETYAFLTEGSVAVPTPKEAEGENAAVTPYDFAGTDNYLMIIPADFSGEGAAATLTIAYTTTFDGKESTLMTKTLPISTKFEQGKAYSLNLVFEQNKTNPISFSVAVVGWGDEENVVAGNPENGTTPAPAPDPAE